MNCFNYRFIGLPNIDDTQFQSIRESVPIYGVVCIKKQDLSIDQLMAFTERMGTPVLQPNAIQFANKFAAFPEVARLSHKLRDSMLTQDVPDNDYWHSDGGHWHPGTNYIFNLQYSPGLPSTGNRIAFTDLCAAYQSLDKSTQNAIEDVTVRIHFDGNANQAPGKWQPNARHRIKHLHPETGQTGLYFGNPYVRIDDVPTAESDDIIKELVTAIEKPENQYVHEWEAGDLLIWDNMSVMHKSLDTRCEKQKHFYQTQAYITPAVEQTGENSIHPEKSWVAVSQAS